MYLLLPGAAGSVLAILFWALSILYQGMVVEAGAGTSRMVDAITLSGELDSQRRAGVLATPHRVHLGRAQRGIGFILLIIPGLFLIVIWSVVAPVVVLERPGVFAAFGRSRELVRGNGWNVFAVIVLVFLARRRGCSVAAGLATNSKLGFRWGGPSCNGR